MSVIKKKIQPEYFEQIRSGIKKYELRLNDFAIAKDDELLLQEWDGQSYTGREMLKKVTMVRPFDINKLFWSKEDIEKHGLQIISFD